MPLEPADSPNGMPLGQGNSKGEKNVEEGEVTSQGSTTDAHKNSIVYIHGGRFWLISIAYV